MIDPRKNLEINWEHIFSENAKKSNHSEKFIQMCLDYAANLRKNNMPVIFDETHLAAILGYPDLPKTYRMLSNDYAVYEIKKRNGKGTREINSPRHDLKNIQQWIYRNILQRDTSVVNKVYSFLPKGYSDREHISIKENAAEHSSKSWVINIDLKDFFGSIKKRSVKSYFLNLGYVEEVAEMLATLCCYKYKLPQGAPTSPMLSNLIAVDLDKSLIELAQIYGSSYTRYADDITFSGSEKKLIPKSEIYNAIKDCGFIPNYSKTKIRLRGERQMVTGLTVTHDVHVPKSYRKEVWRELYFIEKFGFVSHLKKHEETIGRSAGFYKQWLLGRIMHIRSINPDIGNEMLAKFNSLSML